MEKNCPCCNKHCPADNLSCPTGKKHFGIEDTADSRAHDHLSASEDKLLVLLRQCGHFLHHNVGNAADTADLFKVLSAEERQTLEILLTKCLQSWQ